MTRYAVKAEKASSFIFSRAAHVYAPVGHIYNLQFQLV